MFAFIFSFILIFAEGGHGAASGGFGEWWHNNADPYLNYPGFEVWRFLNLIIFLAIMVSLLRKPLSSAFKAKRDQIRAELIRAEEERRAAQAKLVETEAKLARLDADKQNIIERARNEAAAEKQKIGEQTEFEIKKLREQTENEITRTAKQAKQELRKLSAEETIRMAEEIIKDRINPQTDAQLVKANIQSIGGMK